MELTREQKQYLQAQALKSVRDFAIDFQQCTSSDSGQEAAYAMSLIMEAAARSLMINFGQNTMLELVRGMADDLSSPEIGKYYDAAREQYLRELNDEKIH